MRDGASAEQLAGGVVLCYMHTEAHEIWPWLSSRAGRQLLEIIRNDAGDKLTVEQSINMTERLNGLSSDDQ